MNLTPVEGLDLKEVLVIRNGNSCVAAVPNSGPNFELRAEELLTQMREQHYAEHKRYYRDWDQYCFNNNWWITKVPVGV